MIRVVTAVDMDEVFGKIREAALSSTGDIGKELESIWQINSDAKSTENYIVFNRDARKQLCLRYAKEVLKQCRIAVEGSTRIETDIYVAHFETRDVKWAISFAALEPSTEPWAHNARFYLVEDISAVRTDKNNEKSTRYYHFNILYFFERAYWTVDWRKIDTATTTAIAPT